MNRAKATEIMAIPIGYIAMLKSGKVLGNKSSYVVTGSEEIMRTCIKKLSTRSCSEYRIQPINFGEIMERLLQGLTFVFDKVAYQRFLPLGQQEGIKLTPDNLPEDSVEKLIFIKVGVTKS